MIASTKIKIFLLFTSVFISVLCAEAGARIWLNHFANQRQYLKYALYTDIAPQYLRFQPHAYLDYALSPNFREGLTSHNSLGYRGDEFPKAKPEGEFRIVALGGSTTYDEDVEDNNETHTKQLENILRTQYGYSNVRVINAGVSAYNSWESLVNLQFRVLDISPDMVIHYDNNNDAHARLVLPSKYSGDNAGRRKPWTYPQVPRREWSVFVRILSRYWNYTRQVGLEDFVDAHYPYIIDGYSESIGGDPMKVLQQNPPIYFERNTRNMVAIEKENGIVPVLVTYAYTPVYGDYAASPHYQKAFSEHNEIYKQIADKEKVPLLDLQSLMPKDKEYFTDGRHSTALGARRRAEIYAEFLTSHNLIPNKLRVGSH